MFVNPLIRYLQTKSWCKTHTNTNIFTHIYVHTYGIRNKYLFIHCFCNNMTFIIIKSYCCLFKQQTCNHNNCYLLKRSRTSNTNINLFRWSWREQKNMTFIGFVTETIGLRPEKKFGNTSLIKRSCVISVYAAQYSI